MRNKTPTPRTDEAHWEYGLSVDFMAFVRSLERETQRLKRKVKILMDRNARLRKERDELKKTIRNTAIL